jgi:hypothetical protein
MLEMESGDERTIDVVLMHLTLTQGNGTGNCGTDGCSGGIHAADTVQWLMTRKSIEMDEQ